MNDSSSPTPSPQHAVVATHTEKSYKQADGEPDSIAQATAIVRLADVVDECAGKNHKTELHNTWHHKAMAVPTKAKKEQNEPLSLFQNSSFSIKSISICRCVSHSERNLIR